MKEFVFVTSNKNKVREVEAILGIKLKRAALELHEIQDLDLAKVIEHKTRDAYRRLRKPVLVEDVGLYVKDWRGFPGPFVKWLYVTMGLRKFARILSKKNRQAEWLVMYGLFDGQNFHPFSGRIKGALALAPRGMSGWGFDPYFIPAGYRQTYAQMGQSEKLKISARRIALQKLKKFLKKAS